MHLFKETIKKLFSGFIYGAGFILGIWAIAFFVIGNVNIPVGSKEVIAETEGSRVNQKASSITILSSKVIARPYLIDVIGTLKNVGDAPARNTELVADLYNKYGDFIYQCKGWLSEVIQPDAEANFKIDCHSITDEIYQGYSSHKIKVTR